MKNNMKKITALLMAICMAFVPSGISLAQTDENYSLSKIALKEKVQEDVSADELNEIYKEYSILASHMGLISGTLSSISKKDGWVFHVTIEGIENEISLEAKTDKKVSILCRQNDIENYLDIYSNGKMILDDNQVEIKYENNEWDSNGGIMPLVSTSYWKKNPPYGKAADYTVSAGSTKNANVSLGKAIKSIAVSVFYTILTPVIGGVSSIIYQSLYTIVKSQDPQTKGLSYKAKKYYHKKQRSAGYIPAANLYVTKYNYTWYSRNNYKGKTSKQTAYYVKQMG